LAKARRRFLGVAKAIKIGRSQGIRLPKEFRVATKEIYLKRTPDRFLVIAKDPWDSFFEGVKELSDGFMAGSRIQPML
jgi:virulence-associated protein VagC